MATVLDAVDIRGLRKTHFDQLLCYAEHRDREGWYYGNKDHFEKRHNQIKKWFEGIVKTIEEDDVIIPKKPI